MGQNATGPTTTTTPAERLALLDQTLATLNDLMAEQPDAAETWATAWASTQSDRLQLVAEHPELAA